MSLGRGLDELAEEFAEVELAGAAGRVSPIRQEASPTLSPPAGGGIGRRQVVRPGSLGGSPTDHTVELGVDFAEHADGFGGSLGGIGTGSGSESAGLPRSSRRFPPLVLERVRGRKSVGLSVTAASSGGGQRGGAVAEGNARLEGRREHARGGVPLDYVALAAVRGGGGVGPHRSRRSSIAEMEMEIEEDGEAEVDGAGTAVDGVDERASSCSDADQDADGQASGDRVGGERLDGATEDSTAREGAQKLSTAAEAKAAVAPAVVRGTDSPHDGNNDTREGAGGEGAGDPAEGSDDDARVSRSRASARRASSELLVSALEGSVSAASAAAVRPPAHRRASSFSTQGELSQSERRRASLHSMMGTGRQPLVRSASASATTVAAAPSVEGREDAEEEDAVEVTEGVVQPEDVSMASPASQEKLPPPSSSTTATTVAPVARPPLHRLNRRASVSSAACGHAGREGNRRSSLQTAIVARPRRASIAPPGREGGQSRSEVIGPAASSLRRRLSVDPVAAEAIEAEGAAGSGEEQDSGPGGATPTVEGGVGAVEALGEQEKGVGGEMEVGPGAEAVHEMDEGEEEEEGEEDEEEIAPLAMTIEVGGRERWSVVRSVAGLFLRWLSQGLFIV